MQLRSGMIIHMADEVSNVNGGLSTNNRERHAARGNNESFDNVFQNENDVLNRGCYVSLPESEVVKIAVMGLGFYMRQKLLNVHIPDLVHLVERVCQVELMKKEKEKYKNEQRLKSKSFT
ncbi:hypothetical protein Ahy_A09g044977 [Arachis hypogaea]|uniref:Uncharacterized protein n=1 Tax=Arachis hypogaea TaxID=3818 RepID=A0A445BL63_ARAHY|nr:hypothetical protein Ahy_A09g044977 [Arachis hypogaea]